MRNLVVRSPMIAVVGLGLLLSGCATRESVEQAQSTADAAKGDADAAMSAAQRAQNAADAAARAAQEAQAAAQAANDKIDRHLAEHEAAGKHHRTRHHHHHRKAAELQNPNCLPQKS